MTSSVSNRAQTPTVSRRSSTRAPATSSRIPVPAPSPTAANSPRSTTPSRHVYQKGTLDRAFRFPSPVNTSRSPQPNQDPDIEPAMEKTIRGPSTNTSARAKKSEQFQDSEREEQAQAGKAHRKALREAQKQAQQQEQERRQAQVQEQMQIRKQKETQFRAQFQTQSQPPQSWPGIWSQSRPQTLTASVAQEAVPSESKREYKTMLGYANERIKGVAGEAGGAEWDLTESDRGRKRGVDLESRKHASSPSRGEHIPELIPDSLSSKIRRQTHQDEQEEQESHWREQRQQENQQLEKLRQEEEQQQSKVASTKPHRVDWSELFAPEQHRFDMTSPRMRRTTIDERRLKKLANEKQEQSGEQQSGKPGHKRRSRTVDELQSEDSAHSQQYSVHSPEQRRETINQLKLFSKELEMRPEREPEKPRLQLRNSTEDLLRFKHATSSDSKPVRKGNTGGIRSRLSFENLHRRAIDNATKDYDDSDTSPSPLGSEGLLNVPRSWGTQGRASHDWLQRVTRPESPNYDGRQASDYVLHDLALPIESGAGHIDRLRNRPLSRNNKTLTKSLAHTDTTGHGTSRGRRASDDSCYGLVSSESEIGNSNSHRHQHPKGAASSAELAKLAHKKLTTRHLGSFQQRGQPLAVRAASLSPSASPSASHLSPLSASPIQSPSWKEQRPNSRTRDLASPLQPRSSSQPDETPMRPTSMDPVLAMKTPAVLGAFPNTPLTERQQTPALALESKPESDPKIRLPEPVKADPKMEPETKPESAGAVSDSVPKLEDEQSTRHPSAVSSHTSSRSLSRGRRPLSLPPLSPPRHPSSGIEDALDKYYTGDPDYRFSDSTIENLEHIETEIRKDGGGSQSVNNTITTSGEDSGYSGYSGDSDISDVTEDEFGGFRMPLLSDQECQRIRREEQDKAAAEAAAKDKNKAKVEIEEPATEVKPTVDSSVGEITPTKSSSGAAAATTNTDSKDTANTIGSSDQINRLEDKYEHMVHSIDNLSASIRGIEQRQLQLEKHLANISRQGQDQGQRQTEPKKQNSTPSSAQSSGNWTSRALRQNRSRLLPAFIANWGALSHLSFLDPGSASFLSSVPFLPKTLSFLLPSKLFIFIVVFLLYYTIEDLVLAPRFYPRHAYSCNYGVCLYPPDTPFAPLILLTEGLKVFGLAWVVTRLVEVVVSLLRAVAVGGRAVGRLVLQLLGLRDGWVDEGSAGAGTGAGVAVGMSTGAKPGGAISTISTPVSSTSATAVAMTTENEGVVGGVPLLRPGIVEKYGMMQDEVVV